MELTLAEYQREAVRTHNGALSDKEAKASYALGLAGEAGEVADVIKKTLFHGHDLNRAQLVKELGDVYWYLSAVAWMFGISSNEVLTKNIEKLRKRFPNGFSNADSISRKDKE